ncbi:TolC family protein [Hydrogenobacter thermophilus]|uniref:TolC family protein n=1 Tax=Hydrogenobacter thermophilus TaxID=940 RepID=UPI0030FA0ECC
MMLFLLLLVGVSYGLDLMGAIEMALSFYPSLKALEEERKGIEGKSLLYKSYLNPTLGIEMGNFGTSKDGVRSNPIYRLSYSQPILIYPLGSLIREAVRYESSAFEERIAQERNSLKGEVYLAFYSALYRKDLLSIAQENYQISYDVYSFVKKLFDLGEVTKLELFRAERELDLAKTELELARSDYQNALKKLSLFVGEEVKEVEGSLEHLRDMKVIKVEELPQIRQYNYLIKSVKTSIEVERTLAKPQLSTEVLGEKVSESEYGFRIGFSATLPVFYRREGEILQLSSYARSLERLRDLERMKAESEYHRLLKRYQAIKDEVRKINDELLTRSREELSLAIKSYRLRTITALELSDTKRRYIQLLRYRSDLLMQAHEEYAKYLSLGGEL